MKNLIYTLIALIMLAACDRESDTGKKKDEEPVVTTGKATFWVKKDFGCGNITVTINGVSRQISGFNAESSPNCGDSNTASFTLEPGTYAFTAKCSGINWEGSIKVTKDGCQLMELTYTPAPPVNQTGQATFWTKSDLGCGIIKVTINGQIQQISSYYTGGVTSCASSGCANFTLPPGTYNYTASCQNLTWTNTIVITSNGCNKVQLIK